MLSYTKPNFNNNKTMSLLENILIEKDFKNLFQNNPLFIDVRAPIEFKKGAIPGAINLPILNNKERELVGTCYAQKGAQKATELGYQLVSGEIKTNKIQQWESFLKTHPHAFLYCARGGQRSQIAQKWLQESGMSVTRIQKGYKALRNYLLNQITKICPELNLLVVCGKTGTGKTTYLKKQTRYIDLEALANHRGSAFGAHKAPQPTIANFENQLAVQLIKLNQQKGSKVFIEDESRLIGKILVPDPLYNKIKVSPSILLETSLNERINNILYEYIIAPVKLTDNLESIQNIFLHNLERIRPKLGGALFKEIATDMIAAFNSTLKSNNFDLHTIWIKKLLTHYYDPMYDYSMAKRVFN